MSAKPSLASSYYDRNTEWDVTVYARLDKLEEVRRHARHLARAMTEFTPGLFPQEVAKLEEALLAVTEAEKR